jgi:threonine/homoserine/homoserine lactone efflux protein
MEFLLSIIFFAIPMGITPGPNNIMLMTSGLNHGMRNSMPHFWGINIGFPLMFIIVGTSLGVIFNQYPILHELIKVVGLFYLLYLAWRIANTVPATVRNNESRPFTFFQAMLFQWVNPKAWVMMTGAIAAFTTKTGNIYLQIGTIALVFFCVGLMTATVWLLFGTWLKRYLKTPKHQNAFNFSMAMLLVLSISPVAYDLIIQYLL